MVFTNLAKLLKSQRIQKGLTQAELAKKLRGMHTQYVSNWERGICYPPSRRLRKLVAILEVDPQKVEEAYLEDARIEIHHLLYGKR